MSGLEQRIQDAVRGQTQPTVTVLSSLLASNLRQNIQLTFVGGRPAT